MNRNFKNYMVTYIFIGICVIVYLYTSIRYSFDMNALEGLMAGALHPGLVVENHEYYRLLTANFIHFGIMHIVCNCVSLYNVGTAMEYLLGRGRYLAVILASMFTTTAIPVLLYVLMGVGANSVMAGFSGAIFGLIGSLIALAFHFKDVYMRLFSQIVPSLVLMLLLSILMPSISLLGHVSGLIGGYLMTVIIIYFFPLPAWKNRYFVN